MNSFMGSTDVITFYSYGNPDPANSNTGLEQSDAMMLMLYEDPNGNISLVILLDDGDDNTGGTETIALNCIPGSANVSFINDPNDDDVQETGAQITGNFAWGQPFNDGVVIGGMGCGATFTIDAEYADGISSAGFVQGSEGAPITQFLPNTDPILISCGNSVCCAEEYDVQGSVVNPSCPTSTDGAIFAAASGGIAPYQWDISGPDGFFATEFTSADNEQFTLGGLGAGTYQVTVTDSQGQLYDGCTVETTFTLTPNATPPLAQTPPFPLTGCSLDGITAEFDLTELDSLISGGDPNYTVEWYEDQDLFFPIFFPLAYTATGPFPTTVYARITDGVCPSDPVPVVLDAVILPVTIPVSFEQCEEGNTSTATFDLTLKEDSIRAQDDDVFVNWYEDNALSTPISDPSMYESGTATIYVQLEKQGCLADPEPIELTVLENPEGTPDTLSECADAAGFADFDLLAAEPDIYSGAGTVAFYQDSMQMDSIDTPSPYNSEADTIYAFITEGECVSAPVPVYLNPILSPAGPPDTLRRCDDGAGNAVFNLEALEPGLLGSSDSIAWYSDAAGSTPIASPGSFDSPDATVYYSLFTEGCESPLSEVELDALPTPLVQADTLQACDDGTGTAAFDLTTADVITNGAGSLSWYEDAALGSPIADPANYTSAAGTVYAQAAQDSCLSNVAEIELLVNSVDVADSYSITQCGGQSGFSTFDLTAVEDSIYAGAGTIEWYTDAGQANPIATPGNYNSPSSTVYAFAIEGPCTSVPVPVTLTVIVSAPGPADEISLCGDGMGMATFDLTSIEGGLIGGSDSLAWYEDAAGTAPIPGPSAVQSGTSTVYYTLFTQGCESPASPVDLTPLPSPLVQADTLETCDEGGGQGSYDLTSADIITNGVGTVNWYEDPAGTVPIANTTDYFSTPGTVYAQAEEGTCSSNIVPVELELIAAVTASSDSLSLCGDGAGSAVFDLTLAEDSIRGGGGGAVSWFEDAAASTTIAGPASYESGTATIYANVTAGSCVSDTVPIFLTVLPLPAANAASQQSCADPATGEGTFDLTALEAAVSGGAGDVNWFADSLLSAPIANPGNYTSPDTTVFAAVFDGECTSLPAPVELEVLPLPATAPDTLRSCDNGSGTPVFDLTQANVTTVPGASISWFENANATGTIFDPANYASGGGSVYAVVDGGDCTAPPVEVVLEAIFAESPDVACSVTANDSVAFSWLMVADSFSVTYDINGGPPFGPLVVTDTTFSVTSLMQGDEVNITVTALVDPLCTAGITSSATCLADVCQPINFTYNLEEEYCSDEGVVNLTATPGGGTFSGPGVTGSTLDLSGLSGSSFVFYDYFDAATGCDYRDSVEIEVFGPLPAVAINCDSATVNDVYFSWSDAGANNYQVVTSVGGVADTIVTTQLSAEANGLSALTDVDISVTPLGPPPCGNGPAAAATCTSLPCPPAPIPGEFLADEYCSDTSGIGLPGLYPGGIYSGPGVSGNSFDPSVAGAGQTIVEFSFTDTANGCAYILEDITEIIDPLAPPAIACAGATPNSVAFSWSGGTPDGYQYYYQIAGEAPTAITATLDDSLLVSGITDVQDVTIYVSAVGQAPCGDSPFDSLTCTSAPCPDVPLSIPNLLAEYCTNEAAFALQGSPAGGTFSGPGVAGGTFDPAAADTGLVQIIYDYTDPATGCSYSDTFATTLFEPLETPAISCGEASPSSANFLWNDVGADSYSISWTIDGLPGGSDIVTDTAYSITGLLPEQDVEMAVIAQGPPPCGDAPAAAATCSSTPCPAVSFEFTAPSPVCSEDAPLQLGVNVIGSSSSGSVSWSGDGIANADGLFDPTTAVLGDNAITIEYVDGVCSYDTTVFVNVHPQPEASFTVDGSFCSDSTLTLTFNGSATDIAAFDWQLDGGTVVNATDDIQLEVSWPAPGNYELGLYIEDGGCTTDTVTQAVELIAPLVPPVISCEPDGYTSIVFSWPAVENADSYDVTTSSGTGTLNDTVYTVTGLLPGESTTIEVTAIGTTPCGPVSSTLSCSTPPCPDISFEFIAPSPVCSEDDPIQLSATIANSNPEGIVTWTGDGIVNDDGLFDPTVANLGDNAITITYDEAGVCVFDTTVFVNVHPQPEASFTVDGSFCSDSTLTLTFNGSATDIAAFDWQLDGGTVVNATDDIQLEVSWPAPGNYTPSLQIEDGGCVSNLFELPVELIAPLVPPAISCEPLNNTQILFTWPAVEGADDYQVSITNGTGSADTDTSFLVSGLLPEQSTEITVTAVGTTPCGPVTSQLECSTPPCAPQSSSLSGPQDVCQGEDVAFAISLEGGAESGYQFNYRLNGQADSIVLSSPDGLEIAFEDVQDTLELELLEFFSLDNPVCVYDAGQSWQVNVMPPPTAGTALEPVELCQAADSLVVLNELLAGETPGGSWSISSGGNPPGFNQGSGTQATAAMPPGQYTYLYLASGMGICPDSREEVEIVINPTPEVDAGPSQELSCNMGMVSLGSGDNPTGPGYSYNWSSPTPGVVISNPNTAILETGQAGTYALMVTDPNGCTNSDQTEAIANLDAPVASFSSQNPSCNGDSDGAIVIDSITGGAPPFSVMLDGQPMGSQSSFANLPDGEYTITVAGSNGCFIEQVFDLVEPDPMTVSITTDIQPNEKNELVSAYGDTVFVQAVTNSPAPIDTFLWRPFGQGSSFEFEAQESGSISVTAIDVNGCLADDQIQIFAERIRDVYVPNIFSPNEDGKNDWFFIQSGDQVVEIESFRVYNRWGETVFEAENIQPNVPSMGWDGKFRGEFMNPAVFVWYAEVRFNDGEVFLLKGDVTLMR